MSVALEHRGPDSRGVYFDEGVGLGVQRLRVIDLHRGDQPIFNEDKSVVVVLNGEIYNYRALRRRLERSGHRFATDSDTEVIVHLYEERGAGCVHDIHGMFAFAIWDVRRRQLMLARDRVGKKPLYYAHRSCVLSFASELNALMEDHEIPRDIDYNALDCYLAYEYVPAPLSAFRGVRKLPPASTLVFQSDRVTVDTYWRLDYGRRTPLAGAELHAEIRDQIRSAVRRRLLADVPLGAFLSGGIDSSAVVAAMAEASPEPVKTFSVGFVSDRFNELPQARRVATEYATDHHEFVVEPDVIDVIPQIVRQYGEPFGDASAVPSFYVAELARPHVTVALNGDGGDESFAGYPRYAANMLLQALDRLPLRVRRKLAASLALLPSNGTVDSPINRVRRLMATLALAPRDRYIGYVSHLDGLEPNRLYTDEFRKLVGESVVEDVIARPWSQASGKHLVDVMLQVDIETYLPGDLLAKMDIASMAYSLEVRSPLLDHQLMEFAASIPGPLKVSGLRKKVVLRDALRGWVPDFVLDGPKRGFELPIAEWFRGELRHYVRERLLDPAARRRGYFREEYVETLLEDHHAGRKDNSRGLWTLLIFELWQEEFVDRPRHE